MKILLLIIMTIYKTLYPKIAVYGTKYKCIERARNGHKYGRCLKRGHVPYPYKTEFDVKVSTYAGNRKRGRHGMFLFHKELIVSTCEDTE